MRFYKRNERECIVCKKYFQSNIALTQLLFFVKTTYFHGSIARGFDSIERFLKNCFDSAKDLGYFVNEIQKQKTENPFEKQWFEHFFFLKQHEVSNTFQNGPNQNVRAGPPPVTL
jgi:hypothetical protein